MGCGFKKDRRGGSYQDAGRLMLLEWSAPMARGWHTWGKGRYASWLLLGVERWVRAAGGSTPKVGEEGTTHTPFPTWKNSFLRVEKYYGKGQ